MWLDIHIHKEAKNYQPYLNGKKLDNCFAAFEGNGFFLWRKGWADCYKTDEKGKLLLNEDQTEIRKIRLFGKVKFVKIK